ncbi:threonine/serine exporter family protein, partial [Staphylococcus epidermidis]|uniref:threonine/serine exporter family protein n=1 Tax=Staphylococcus epidermidis TaxID=1282 RepID=UPI0037DA5B98
MIPTTFLYLHPPPLLHIITPLLAPTIPYLLLQILDRNLHTQFIPQFIRSFLIPIISLIPHPFLPTPHLPTIIIPPLIPIVPPLLITNPIQDLFPPHI